MTQGLIEAKKPETELAKHLGHKDVRIMKDYNNLRGSATKRASTEDVL